MGPNSAQTTCVPCGPLQISTIGLCVSCPVGRTATVDRTECSLCESGFHRPMGSSECRPCPAGTAADEAAVSCIPCSEPGTFSADGVSCLTCSSGHEPNFNRTACQECAVGFAGVGGSCEICPEGTSSSNRVVCERCPVGMASQRGTACALCGPGSQPNADQSQCVSCVLSGPLFFSPDGQSCRHAPYSGDPEALGGCVDRFDQGEFSHQNFI